MISPVDVFLYALACGFGIAVPILVIVVFMIVLVDRLVIKPEYERIDKNG